MDRLKLLPAWAYNNRLLHLAGSSEKFIHGSVAVGGRWSPPVNDVVSTLFSVSPLRLTCSIYTARLLWSCSRGKTEIKGCQTGPNHYKLVPKNSIYIDVLLFISQFEWYQYNSMHLRFRPPRKTCLRNIRS
jgi:hypothetical protein